MVCQDSSSDTAPSPELLKTASSSSSSPESNFRELDDAFLQTQTRIWLGEVLKIRLNEQLIISELLADGELLFLVSKVVWKLLLAKHMELKHIKASRSQPFASKSNSGRYRPYSNVDSFLKICKILELTGVDLFSPSDVVERKNTRKVPDFDIVNVTCAVTMPKDVVRCIRKSIELSHRRPADSFTDYLQKSAGQESREVYLSVTDSIKDWETYSDQSNDTEIKHPAHQSFDDLHGDESDDLYDYASEVQYNSTSPIAESDFMSTDLDQNQETPRISDYEFQLLCSRELLQYHISEAPYSGNVDVEFSGGISHLDTRGQESRMMEFGYTENELLADNGSNVGTPINDRRPVIRDVSSNAKDSWDHDLLIEENVSADIHKSGSSHGSCATPPSIENSRCFGAGENMEVLHEDGLSCLSREFEAESDSQRSESLKLHNDKNNQWEDAKEYESQDKVKFKEIEQGITSYENHTYFVKELEETENSLYSPDCFLCNKTDSSNTAVSNSIDINTTLSEKCLVTEDLKSHGDTSSLSLNSCNQCEKLLPCQCSSLPQFCKWDQKGKCPMTKSGVIDHHGSHEETMPQKQEIAEENAVSATVSKPCDNDEEQEDDSQAIASNAMSLDECEDGGDGVIDMILNDATVPANCDEDVSNTGTCITNQSSELECNDGHQTSHQDMVPVQEVIDPDKESVCSFDKLDEREVRIVETAKAKPRKKLILKSVFGGATAVGLLFMFLHLRRTGKDKDAYPVPNKASNDEGKEKSKKYAPPKAKRTTEGLYSAEKLKLK
ncbi:hypothetical protein PIB30_009394 [Stylosanthes scabra]|uniref:Calponin-homology (CH) domain-containing protein n=1 Tax=Stylosanthes scabra TaxID=79078 RepID=A0ABU6V5I4_9FABA|nr:hypothetical protein [Stylosanthes scabra]